MRSPTFLSSLLLLPAGSLAYVASNSLSGVLVQPTFLSTKTTSPKYDLGLGKNPPLVKQEQDQMPTNVYQAAAYWMVSDSVREFPAPNEPSLPKKKAQPIVPHRKVPDDVVGISGSGHDTRAVVVGRRTSLDINTLWVEMLIHDQQQQQQQQQQHVLTTAAALAS